MSVASLCRRTTLSLLAAGLAISLTACGDHDKAAAAAAPVAAAAPAPAASPDAPPAQVAAAAQAMAPAPAATPAPATQAPVAAAKPLRHHHEHRTESVHASAAPAEPVCANCGVVTGVRAVTEPGQASGLGAVGGAVAGGVLGHQTGRGHGKDAMTVLGAIGGALAGNYAEKQMRQNQHYEVSVRFNDGSTQTFRFPQRPPVQTGDRVREDGGTLLPQ